MNDQLLIYQEQEVKFFLLQPEEQFVVGGTGKKTDYQLPADIGARTSVTLRFTDRQWEAVCKGDVFAGGREVKQQVLRHGDMLTLGNPPQVGLQFLSLYDTPAEEMPLVPGQEILIGRGENCNLRFINRRVSSSHAKIYQIGSVWHISDISSTNGTFVNGSKIHDAELSTGDRILIGSYLMEFSDNRLRIFGDPDTISLNLPEEEAAVRSEYPYYSISPRLIKQRPQGKITIDAAPGIGQTPKLNIFQMLMPLIGMLLAATVMTVVMKARPVMFMFSVPMMLIGAVGSVMNYRSQKASHEGLDRLRTEKYESYIKEKEEEIRAAQRAQQDALLSSNPSPEECIRLVEHLDRRLWERTIRDNDFMALRAGLGEEPLSVEVDVPRVGFTIQEDTYTRTPEQLKEAYRTVTGMPVLADLMRTPGLGIVGPRESITLTARALVLQAAFNHSYQDLKLVFLYDDSRKEEWDMMRWLPHTAGGAQIRYMAVNSFEAGHFLQDIADDIKGRAAANSGQWQKDSRPQLPYYLFIVDQPALLQDQPVLSWLLRNDPMLGIGSIYLSESITGLPGQIQEILEISGGTGELYYKDNASERRSLVPDTVNAADAERFARSMAPIRLPEKDSSEMLPTSISWMEGYNIQKPEELDLEDYWANARPEQSMSVPIGVRANGESFNFDIHEKKHGPHGLVAGMTGSGKSEMVQSWILSMATQFSPLDVSFVLIDFKGTGLILPFVNLPHLAGTISDLDSNISRNLIALEAELQRRKALFDAAGVNNITGYLKLYRAGKVTEPLSYLFVIIDEYAEFKAKFPDFTSEVNSLFRTGRSMGVHIMLLTQNPSGVVSGESETNVRFRWCLKVASAGASKEVLGGHDDAARITNPGRAYVRVGTDEVFEPVQSYYSGAPYDPSGREQKETAPKLAAVTRSGDRITLRTADRKEKKKNRGAEIDAVVAYIRSFTEKQHIPDARHIWQGRMPDRIWLEDLLRADSMNSGEDLAPVVALIDDPARQIQRPYRLPLSSEGHAVIIGSPGSGKTTFLQTLITSLALSCSPEDVRIYAMDFGGWSLGMFRDFPHMAGIANDNEEEKIFSIAQKLSQEMQRRKEMFSAEGVGTLAAYRNLTGEPLPYLVLVVDNFAPVLQLYPKLEDFFIRLGREGGNYGILLVATASTIAGLGYKLNQSIRTHVALQMADVSDYSQIVGRTGGLYPENLPGRGLIRDGAVLEIQTALPVKTSDAGYAKAMRELASKLKDRYGSGMEEELLAMPEQVAYGSVRDPEGKPGVLMLGIRSESLKGISIDPASEQSLLISGLDPEQNTLILKMLLRQAAAVPSNNIAVFGDPNQYAFLESRGDVFADEESVNAYIEALSEGASERAGVKEQDSEARFEPIIFAIDGYRKFVDLASRQTMRRLQALLQNGAGLQIMILAADEPGNIDSLKQFMEPVASALTEGMAILAGGRAMQHLEVSTSLDPIEKNMVLEQGDAWLKKGTETFRFRLMQDAE